MALIRLYVEPANDTVLGGIVSPVFVLDNKMKTEINFN